MPKVNVLIFIHGIEISDIPSKHTAQYNDLLEALRAKHPIIGEKIDKVVYIEWGHALPLPAQVLFPDEMLTDAENTILNATSLSAIKSNKTADDTFLGFTFNFPQRRLARLVTDQIKEKVFALGLTDVLYYCSPDGERAVRSHVYTQVLKELAEVENEEKVALHLIAHSHGATVGFDFLFGLLAPDSQYGGEPPDFAKNEDIPLATREAYLDWRRRAKNGQLALGSKSSFGCQLALMMMRKQRLVNMLAARPVQLLDPTVIGVPKAGPVKWKVFYDTNDVLGYPVRHLFDAVGTIKEFEVDSDPNPVFAHLNYWTNKQVQEEI